MERQAQIEALLEEKIRPFLQSHGGNVRLEAYEDGVLTVALTGACAGCPSADMSTRAFIEETLKPHLPQLRKVSLYRPVSDELLDAARRLLYPEEN